MNNLRSTIDTNRGESGWIDFPINSSILLDDTKQIMIKRKGWVALERESLHAVLRVPLKTNLKNWYSFHNYHDLDIQNL